MLLFPLASVLIRLSGQVSQAVQQILRYAAPSIVVQSHALSKEDLEAIRRSSTLTAVGQWLSVHPVDRLGLLKWSISES